MNRSTEFIKDLKVGDRVILGVWGSWRPESYSIEEVMGFTKSGLLKIGGRLFYPNGRIRGDFCAAIYDINIPENIQELKEYERIKYIRKVISKIHNFNFERISYETAKQLENIMNQIESERKK